MTDEKIIVAWKKQLDDMYVDSRRIHDEISELDQQIDRLVAEREGAIREVEHLELIAKNLEEAECQNLPERKCSAA
jgi:Rps23 Pro-64 3,4-dihydroxylase Tpa1-like proline 4-hydroxylase